jgi:hypothetical protein
MVVPPTFDRAIDKGAGMPGPGRDLRGTLAEGAIARINARAVTAATIRGVDRNVRTECFEIDVEQRRARRRCDGEREEKESTHFEVGVARDVAFCEAKLDGWVRRPPIPL